MVTVVVIINTLIALFNFYVAWRIWQLRGQIARAADTINRAEKSTYNVLHKAPNPIYQGQKGVLGLRDRYHLLTVQMQRLKQILPLLSLVTKFWQQKAQKPRQSKFQKKRSKINL